MFLSAWMFQSAYFASAHFRATNLAVTPTVDAIIAGTWLRRGW